MPDWQCKVVVTPYLFYSTTWILILTMNLLLISESEVLTLRRGSTGLGLSGFVLKAIQSHAEWNRIEDQVFPASPICLDLYFFILVFILILFSIFISNSNLRNIFNQEVMY